MITTKITDGEGKGNELRISKEGTIGVVPHLHPPVDDPIFVAPFRQFFTDDGLPGNGTNNDMQVVGTLADPIPFFITASAEKDLYIKIISFEIADAGADLNQFGNVSARTNGVKFEWITQDLGTVVIHEGMKSNYDFVRLCLGTPTIGTAASSFRANNVISNSEGYIPFLDSETVFGMPWGFRLRKGTQDRLVFSVQDTTTGVDSFNIIGYGSQL